MRHACVFALCTMLASIPCARPALAAAGPPEGDKAAPRDTAPKSAEKSAEPAATVTQSAPPAEHANPRFKLSYRRFSLANIDGSTMNLQGGQIDSYFLSRRWIRIGLEAEGGAGESAASSHISNAWYGLGGLSIGFQYPARVTPFVEGRFAAGVLGGSMTGSIPVAGGASVNLNNTPVATLLYLGGVDVGVEVYTFGRFYLSAALGWAHPVYQGPDWAAMQANPSGGMQVKAVSSDTFTFKVGIGL